MNKKIVSIIRIIFGILLLGFGGLAFYNAALPANLPAQALSFLTVMREIGYINYTIGIIFIAVGLMFTTNMYVALGAILLAPILVNILMFHIFLDLSGIIPGLIFTALEIFVVWSEWGKYRILLRSK